MKEQFAQHMVHSRAFGTFWRGEFEVLHAVARTLRQASS